MHSIQKQSVAIVTSMLTAASFTAIAIAQESGEETSSVDLIANVNDSDGTSAEAVPEDVYADSQEDPQTVSWSTLAPENGRPFNDAFSRLTQEQLADLAFIARIRRLISEEKLEEDGDSAKEAESLAARLTNNGVDIERLLVQRRLIPQLREQRLAAVAESVAKSFDSQIVEVTGFAIEDPGPDAPRGELLVMPTMEFCTHATAPSPLHVIRVTGETEAAFTNVRGTPVRITGRLVAESDSTPIVTAGGVQDYASAYRLIPQQIEILAEQE